MSQWYAIACVSSSGYLGQRWEMFNNSPRRPRTALVDLQHATKCATLTAAKEECRRGKGILGLEFRPVPIGFREGKDKHGNKETRVILETST